MRLYCGNHECMEYLGSLGGTHCTICGWSEPQESAVTNQYAPTPVRLTDEEIIKCLLPHDYAINKALTYDSGPYEVTKLRGAATALFGRVADAMQAKDAQPLVEALQESIEVFDALPGLVETNTEVIGQIVDTRNKANAALAAWEGR